MLLTEAEVLSLEHRGTKDEGIRFARLVEAKIEAKLREQKPSYWANPVSINHVQMLVNSYQVKGYVPLYLHPAPSAPEGMVLVPTDPEGQWSNDDLINIMVDAHHGRNGGHYDSMLAAYKAMLAAAARSGE